MLNVKLKVLLLLYSYKSGIYSDPDCSVDDVNHGIAIVGYGFDADQNETQNYYILKNSFGVTWGEEGYMRIARNGKDTCGVTAMPGWPLVQLMD